MRVFLMALGLLVATAVPLYAEGVYVSGGGGLSLISSSDMVSPRDSVQQEIHDHRSYEAGYGLVAGVGYDFDGLRLEAETGYRRARCRQAVTVYDMSPNIPAVVSSVSRRESMTITSLMINGLVDIKLGYKVAPVIGFGLGMVEGKAFGLVDRVLGGQLTTGVSYSAAPWLNLDFYYRVQTAIEDLKLGIDVPYIGNNFFATLRYTF